jgi:2-hydroxychromene-2-carboxylate isomerase
MKHITFYLDFISPYAWLAFDELPQALMGLSYSVTYKPLLFAALLKHHGQLGPAEIPAKRDWTYRQVQWLAHSKGLSLDLPAAHPFNPLGLLRLALATDAKGQPNRYVCETCSSMSGWAADAADPERLAAVTQQLAPARDPLTRESRHNCARMPKRPLQPECLACPLSKWTARYFGGWTACPCCAPICRGMPGLMDPGGTDAQRCREGRLVSKSRGLACEKSVNSAG